MYINNNNTAHLDLVSTTQIQLLYVSLEVIIHILKIWIVNWNKLNENENRFHAKCSQKEGEKIKWEKQESL